MAIAKLYNQQGKDIGTVELSDAIFGVSVKEAVVHQAIVAQNANRRTVLAHTKGRGEVRGGGKKPWKQKGTGRARHGSSRSPIWVGGGVTFGPTKERNFSVKINKTMRRQALLMGLSDKAKAEAIVVVNSLLVTGGKTKLVASMLKALPVVGRTLLVVDSKNANVRRASSNIPKVITIAPDSVNVEAVVGANKIVIGQDELNTLTAHFSRK